jgi:hypothetical protein
MLSSKKHGPAESHTEAKQKDEQTYSRADYEEYGSHSIIHSRVNNRY